MKAAELDSSGQILVQNERVLISNTLLQDFFDCNPNVDKSKEIEWKLLPFKRKKDYLYLPYRIKVNDILEYWFSKDWNRNHSKPPPALMDQWF